MRLTAMTTEIADLSAVDAAAAIKSGALSPVDVVDAALSRIDRRSDLNAFMAMSADRARQEAKSAENAIRRGDVVGPLHGVPFSVKDLTDTEGVVTTYGSALFAKHVPTADAVAVA